MGKFIEEKPLIGYTSGYKKEVCDQTPIAIPLGMKKPESMEQMLNRLISNRFQNLQLNGEETFDEADDFDCDDDDIDPASPWEELFDKNGNSVGFYDQNSYQKNSGRFYERRLDDREKSYIVTKNSNRSDGSVQGDSVSSDS